jgi:hypothetical protein
MSEARIAPNQRVVAVGMTRSGKSELLRYLFSVMRTRRVLVDPKGEWRVPGVTCHALTAETKEGAVEQVKAIDWSQPIVHVHPTWQGWEQLAALYGAIGRLPWPVVVWTDEAYGVSSAQRRPPGLIQLQVAGGGRGHGQLIATQRPRNIARELLTESEHIFIFRGLSEPDVLAALEGAPFLPPDQAIELHRALPQYGYLWVDRIRGQVDIGDPLPERLRTLGTIRKRG